MALNRAIASFFTQDSKLDYPFFANPIKVTTNRRIQAKKSRWRLRTECLYPFFIGIKAGIKTEPIFHLLSSLFFFNSDSKKVRFWWHVNAVYMCINAMASVVIYLSFAELRSLR